MINRNNDIIPLLILPKIHVINEMKIIENYCKVVMYNYVRAIIILNKNDADGT